MAQRHYPLVFWAATSAIAAVPAQAQTPRPVSFNKDVLPIFQARCATCHLTGQSGGVRLSTVPDVVRGGAKGPILAKGNPQASRLVAVLEGRQQPKMPPTGPPLTAQQIQVIRDWVQQGAPADGQFAPPPAPAPMRNRPGAPMLAPAAPAAEKPLEIQQPKDGATVREKVKIVVPRASIPAEGFVSVYIDRRFIAAVAPLSAEEIEEKKMKPDAPLTYVWDTQAPPPASDSTLAVSEKIPQDGPHIIEIVSHRSDGSEAERARVQVELRNQVVVAPTQPARLWYGGKVGEQYVLEHEVDLQLNAGEAGTSRSGRAQAVAPGPSKLSHKETARYLVSMEDVENAGTVGFWRERRESPLTVVTNELKQSVRVEDSSRYYGLRRNGDVRVPKVMERERREPILNPLTLPGRLHQVKDAFNTDLRINLGAYIPGALKVSNLQAKVEGVEWQRGERCVRIRLTYNAGTEKLDINSLRIRQGDFSITQGASTIWFSETTNRVIRAEHEVTGNLTVDVAQLSGGSSGYPGGLGGEAAPGDTGTSGGYSPYGMPGGGSSYSPYGMPGGSSGMPPYGSSAGSMYGAPPGYSGGAPGGSSYPPGYGSSAGAPPGTSGYSGGSGGYPGGSSGYPGGSSGYPGGSSGGYPGAGGAGTGLPPPTTKKYLATLKVRTSLVDDNPKDR